MVPREIMHQGLRLLPSSGMLTSAEADFLYDTAASLVCNPRGRRLNWVELGVWCGRSLWAAGCGLPGHSRIHGFDLFSGELPIREGSDTVAKVAPPSLQYRVTESVTLSLIEEQMRAGAEMFDARVFPSRSDEVPPGYEAGDVDVLVVDAAHDYESVKRDLAAWLPKMNPTGIVLGHDYTPANSGVVRAFDERFGVKCEPVPGTRFCRVQL